MSAAAANVAAGRPPPKAGAEATEPHDSPGVVGLFSWTSVRRTTVSEIEIKHYLEANGTKPHPREALEWAGETRAAMVDLKFCDLLGTWQHVSLPISAHYSVGAAEGHWNSGRPGLGYTVREKEGYFPPAPHDTLHDLRTRMVLTLERLGIPCEFHHHEVASGGQCEIDLRFQSLTRMADQVMTYKYVVKNVARAAGKSVTFMPKPIFVDHSSGRLSHHSLWKEETPLMADKSGYAGLSHLARGYVGGLLAHAPALLALCAPTTNSYRRLVPGYEAPVNLVYSQRNRSACIRIPMYSESPKAKRIEFRCPDASANPYLAFAAMLMAGLDGIERGLDPGAPADYDLFEESRGDVAQVPGSLGEALDALEADHEFLTKGAVFSEELIRTWIDYKRENEVDVVRLRPHPAEFSLYYDC